MSATVGAILAAIVAIWGAIVVRGTKVSEWRQAWINDQRGDIANALSALILQSVSVNVVDAKQFIIEFESAYNRICLRENPTYPEWQVLIRKLHDLSVRVRNKDIALQEQKYEQNKILLLGQDALKREWTRVKGGEIGYRVFVTIGSVVTILAVYAFFLAAQHAP